MVPKACWCWMPLLARASAAERVFIANFPTLQCNHGCIFIHIYIYTYVCVRERLDTHRHTHKTHAFIHINICNY